MKTPLIERVMMERARPWLRRLIGSDAYEASLASELDGMKARLAEIDALRARVKELEDLPVPVPPPAYDPLASVPYYPPGITDRHDLGRQIFHDQIPRPSYAFSLWLATLQAAKLGVKRLHVVEFGVAFGAGLENLCRICELITASTDLEFEVTGFDSDVGMPPATDYRDHPEVWFGGQFRSDHQAIRSRLPAHGHLISGDIAVTLPDFIRDKVNPDCPIGFVSIDVDLYTSSLACFELFKIKDPACYLPTSIVYMDDVNDLLTCNAWCGEALAIREFNRLDLPRKLQELRIRQNHPPAGWHDHVYGLHVLDHPRRQAVTPGIQLDINITAL